MWIKQRELCINRALENLLCSLVLKRLIYVLCLEEMLEASLITCQIPVVTFMVITILISADSVCIPISQEFDISPVRATDWIEMLRTRVLGHWKRLNQT